MNNNELMHYGVMGMKWGVRRASKSLSNSKSSPEKRSKAISSLNKHREKSSKKLKQLQSKKVKIDKKTNAYFEKGERKAAKFERKAAKYRYKQYGRFTSANKAAKLEKKAFKYDFKARKIRHKGEKWKAKLHKNERMQELFKQGINNIDNILIEKGKQYVG